MPLTEAMNYIVVIVTVKIISHVAIVTIAMEAIKATRTDYYIVVHFQ